MFMAANHPDEFLRACSLAVLLGVGGVYVARLLAAAMLLCLARRVPGAGRVALRFAPTAVRPLLRRAAIGGMAGALLTSPAALASPTPGCPSPADTPPVLDRGAPCPVPPPAAPPAPAAASGPAGSPVVESPGLEPSPAPDSYEVRPGDSLWAISLLFLGEDASDGQVAQAWPRLWRANLGVVGEDPGLITPGTLLTVPAGLAGGEAQ